MALAAAVAVVLPLSSQLVADEEGPPDELPKSGVLEIVITVDGKPTTTKSITRALSKLEAIQKADARRPDSTTPLLVTINANETTREFTDLTDAIRVVQGVSEILDAAKKLKIQLGELGRLDAVSTQSQQSQTPAPEPAARQQQFRPSSARDGDDGIGVGGGLGGQGGGGAGVANQQQALAGLRGSGAGVREAQIELLRQRLSQLLAVQQQSDPASASVAGKADSKEVKLGEATLFSRTVHRDYQKATFSFEFGLRDDPAYLHANDWDLQYGNGGEQFHVTMVSDDRSRIVDLGKMDWEQLDTARLAKLPPHPQPRREFVPTALGHIYVVHTVDRNTDLYALFRVEAVQQQQGTCDITWRLVDAPQ
ncbi:MAG: hypothetical protein O3C40_37660 [Planctomycetota bacterium]|nr:hypothetical protein [Planctomycetota bacterium]